MFTSMFARLFWLSCGLMILLIVDRNLSGFLWSIFLFTLCQYFYSAFFISSDNCILIVFILFFRFLADVDEAVGSLLLMLLYCVRVLDFSLCSCCTTLLLLCVIFPFLALCVGIVCLIVFRILSDSFSMYLSISVTSRFLFAGLCLKCVLHSCLANFFQFADL